MQRKVIVLAVCICFASASRAGKIDGYAYLQNQTDHQGTLVEVNTIQHHSAVTSASGYFITDPILIPGDYDLLYSHAGYYLSKQEDVPVYLIGTTRADPVTLLCPYPCSFVWDEYPYEPPGTDIEFPQDEGRHDPFETFPVEWWYLNAHLVGCETGEEYGAMVTFFKRPQLRLFSIADLDQGQTYTARGTLGILTTSSIELDLEFLRVLPPLPAGIDSLYNKSHGGNLVPFTYYMSVKGRSMENYQEMELDLNLVSLKPPLIVGGDGLIEVGSAWSYYYSHTRFDVDGTIKVHGLSEPASGYAWFDHQWGNFGLGEMATWEWFSIQLDDLREIMVADVWVNGIPQGSFTGGLNYYDAECNLEVLNNYTIEPLYFWTAPNEETYAIQWHITEPSHDIDLIVTASYPEQFMPLTPGRFFPPYGFWEGSCWVEGTIEGAPVSGDAYAELTHTRTSDGVRLAGENPENSLSAPAEFSLSQNRPNPFNPLTSIRFSLPEANNVELTVHDVSGRRVATLVDDRRDAGTYEVTFDGTGLAAGVYFYCLQVGQFEASGKMVLMK